MKKYHFIHNSFQRIYGFSDGDTYESGRNKTSFKDSRSPVELAREIYKLVDPKRRSTLFVDPTVPEDMRKRLEDKFSDTKVTVRLREVA